MVISNENNTNSSNLRPINTSILSQGDGVVIRLKYNPDSAAIAALGTSNQKNTQKFLVVRDEKSANHQGQAGGLSHKIGQFIFWCSLMKFFF
ncbi:MAG: hypothetical protein ACKO11_12545 [Cuspidothrix sp.]